MKHGSGPPMGEKLSGVNSVYVTFSVLLILFCIAAIGSSIYGIYYLANTESSTSVQVAVGISIALGLPLGLLCLPIGFAELDSNIQDWISDNDKIYKYNAKLKKYNAETKEENADNDIKNIINSIEKKDFIIKYDHYDFNNDKQKILDEYLTSDTYKEMHNNLKKNIRYVVGYSVKEGYSSNLANKIKKNNIIPDDIKDSIIDMIDTLDKDKKFKKMN
jgi:hypothetical protein